MKTDRNTDQDIDRVLSALRDTTPSPAMERRLLNSLTAQQLAAQSRTGSLAAIFTRFSRSSLSSTIVLAFELCAVAAIALIVAVPRILPIHHPIANVASHPTLPPAGPRVRPVEPQYASVPVSRPRLHLTRSAPTTYRAPVAAIELTAASCHCDPVALAETLAPSKPAPPLPLTAQEVMLLRVVSHGNTVELAQLDPTLRARSNARDRARFQNFFAPSPTGDKE